MIRATLTAVALVLGTCSAPAPSDERVVFDQINELRAEHGLPALGWNDDAALGSEVWAQVQHDEGLHHRSVPAPELADWWLMGEVIAFVYERDRAIALWEASPSHLATILDSRYVEGGVGIVRDSVGHWFVVAEFVAYPGRLTGSARP